MSALDTASLDGDVTPLAELVAGYMQSRRRPGGTERGPLLRHFNPTKLFFDESRSSSAVTHVVEAEQAVYVCIGRQRMRKYRKVAALLPGHLDTLDRNTRGVLDPTSGSDLYAAGTTTTHPGRHGRHRRNGSQHDRCTLGNGPHVNDGDSCGAQCNRAAIDLVAVCAVVKHRAAPNVERLVRLRGTDQDPLRRVLDPRPRGDPPRLGRLERLVERCRGVRVKVPITGTTRLSG